MSVNFELRIALWRIVPGLLLLG